MVKHFSYNEIVSSPHWFALADGMPKRPQKIGCGAENPDFKSKTLDNVTCSRCKNSRAYKACRAFVLGLIDKKMLNKIGFCAPKKL